MLRMDSKMILSQVCSSKIRTMYKDQGEKRGFEEKEARLASEGPLGRLVRQWQQLGLEHRALCQPLVASQPSCLCP